MKRLKTMAAVVGLSSLASLAHAGTARYEFHNESKMSFDYSLQLAQVEGSVVYMGTASWLGKYRSDDLTLEPIIAPSQISPENTYQIGGWKQADGVAFNLRTADGRQFGLRKDTFHHTCNLYRNWDDVMVVFTFKERSDTQAPYQLIEQLPDGSQCAFDVTEGYGPSLWS